MQFYMWRPWTQNINATKLHRTAETLDKIEIIMLHGYNYYNISNVPLYTLLTCATIWIHSLHIIYKHFILVSVPCIGQYILYQSLKYWHMCEPNACNDVTHEQVHVCMCLCICVCFMHVRGRVRWWWGRVEENWEWRQEMFVACRA